jgi:ComF family protein
MPDHVDVERPPRIGRLRRVGSRAAGSLRGLSRAALDVIFPSACLSCGAERADGGFASDDASFCRACLANFALSAGGACPRCAAPLPGGGAAQQRPSPCVHCQGRRFAFHAAIAAGRYAGRLRELILRMKRAEENVLSLAIGQLVWERCRESLQAAEVDVVVPVPMHWRRRIAHGTNSAALLAEVVAGQLRVPMLSRALRRCRNTPPQFSLSTNERRANVRGAFAVRGRRRIEEAHVLLVDDIMTSCATCHEAARVLRQAGARRVTVVVATRATPQ